MISIIIPTYNEAGGLPATLASIANNRHHPEIIVVDAGSVDGTPEVAEASGAGVLASPRRQRAFQMNLGAQQALGQTLWFLHADTRVPVYAIDRIQAALLNRNVIGGGFARRYDSDSWFLRMTCLLAVVRTGLTGWFLGDQGIFVRKAAFETLAGFRDIPLFEDLDFSMRLARMGEAVTLFPAVTSSARRFERRGAIRTTFSDALLTWRYFRGKAPDALGYALPPSAEHARPQPFREPVKQEEDTNSF